MSIQPIPPSQFVDAVNKSGDNIIKAGQSISHPFALYLFTAAGIAFVIGVILHALGITKTVLVAALSMIFGTVIMIIITGHPGEMVGLVLGIIEGFFSHMRGAS